VTENQQHTFIRKLQIRGFRTLRDTTFSPNPGLSVLIGPNGVGKTNILHGLLTLRTCLSPQDRFFSSSEKQEGARVSVSTTYSVKGTDINYSASFTTTEGAKGLEEVRNIEEIWQGRRDDGSEWRAALPSYLFDYLKAEEERSAFARLGRVKRVHAEAADVLVEKITSAVTFNAGLRYYSASHYTDPSRCPSSFEVEEEDQLVDDYSSRGPHRSFLYSLYRLRKRDKASYEAYLDLIGQNGINLVKEILWKEYLLSSNEVKVRQGGRAVRKRRRRTLVIPVVKNRSGQVGFNQLSDGTFKTLALIFHIQSDDWRALLLEEPEVCVHHGLLGGIVELVKAAAKRRQIFLSTHSEQVLDLVNDTAVFPVEISSRGSSVKRLDEALKPRELQALRTYLKESGSLGQYWKHGGLT
jgi:predicted ATP-dependent endonuclease of OLD family